MLCERAHVNRLVAEQLQSKDPAIAADARKLVRRLDRYRAEEIMRSINTKASAQLQALAKDVDAGRGFVTLIPPGSSEGDRYYVRVQWDPSKTMTVNRLTGLLNRELVDRPSMKDEVTFIKGRNERWVYWYSREWAIHIAEEAAKCGGKATFATPVGQRAARSPWTGKILLHSLLRRYPLPHG